MKLRPHHYLIIAGILVVGTIFLLLNPWDRNEYSLESLLPENHENIQRVRLIGENDTLEILRYDSLWVTGGETLNIQAVDNLTIAAENLSMKSILPLDELGEISYGVEIQMDGPRKQEAHFNFVKSGRNYYVFDRSDSDVAYGIELAGYEDYPLEKLFSINLDHYRRHLILKLMPDEISEYSVKPISGTPFLAKKDSLGNTKIYYSYSGEMITDELDDKKVKMLFTYFTAIRYEKILAPDTKDYFVGTDSIIAEFQVTDVHHTQWQFILYPLKLEKDAESDLFRALVKINQNDFYYIINFYYLDLLIRGLESYR